MFYKTDILQSNTCTYVKAQLLPQGKPCAFVANTSRLMLFREIITAFSTNYIKHTVKQAVELFVIEAEVTYNLNFTLKC
jgi:dissimilatory sulfite reductase (desulfoviridin) alpha/beta subunit